MNQGIIKIPATKISPSVLVDKDQMLIQVVGYSYPEDPNDIYRDIIDWLEELDGEVEKQITCEFYFNFLNSSSHKMVFDIMNLLQKLYLKGAPVKVLWYYMDGDDDIMEKGEDFIDIVQVPIELIAK